MSKAQTLSQIAGRHAATVLRVKAEDFDARWPEREHAHLQQVADFFLYLKNKSQSRWKADFFTGPFFEIAGRGPSGAVTAADATSFFGSLSKQEAENENFELSEAYFQLADFCREIANWQKEKNLLRIQMSANSETDIKFTEEDFTPTLKAQGFSRLCKFCWRPVVGATGEDRDRAGNSQQRYTKTRCHLHENQAAEARARYNNEKTPPLLDFLIQRGTTKGFTHSDKYFHILARDFKSMQRNWDNACAEGVVDAVISDIVKLSVAQFDKEGARKSWNHFFAEFCFAYDVDQTATPQDPIYMAVLVYSLLKLQKVKQEKMIKGRTTEGTQEIIARAIEMEKTGRGWQTRLAKEVGLAQQRISAIWKDYQARLGQASG